MFRFYLRRLVQSFFSRSRRRGRPVVRKRVHGYRPYLEGLEDRTVPAIQLTYGGAGTALTLSDLTGTQDNVTISELAGNMLQIDLNGATFDAASSTPANVTYNNGTPGASSIATIDINATNIITTLTANLGDMDDALSLALTNANGGVGNVSLDGQAGTDTVTLNSTTLGNSGTTGNLTVAADIINVSGTVDTTAASGTNGQVSLTADQSISVGGAIKTTGGDITLTAGAANSNSAADVLTINANVTATGGNGSITLNGNSLVVNAATVSVVGAGNVIANFGGTGGAATFNNGSTVSAVNGNISSTATDSTTLNGNATIQTTGTGNITLTTDDVSIAATATISASDGVANGNNVVTLHNFTAGRAIDLGSNTTGTLGLTDTELDRIQAETLRIGRNDASASGTITVSSQINLTAGANTIPTLHLLTGAAVVDGTVTEQTDLTVANLAIEAVTGIGSTDDLDTAVSNLVAIDSGAAASGNIRVTNTGALTITAFDGVTGVQRTGGSLGSIIISAASPLTINAPVTDTTGGDITLTAGAANSNSAADVLTINASVTATGGNGSITLNGNSLVVNAATVSVVGAGTITANFGGTGGTATFNNASTVAAVDGLIDVTATTGVTLNGTATIQTSGTGNIRFTTDDATIAATAMINANTNNLVTLRNFTAGRAINLGSNTNLGLTDAELDRISAGTLIVGRNDASASGTITVSAPIDLTTGAFTIPTLHLFTGADVAETGAGALTVTSLAVQAGTNIALDTNPSNVLNFAASSTTGAVAYRDTNGFTVSTVDGVTGVTTTNQPITLCTDTGDLSLTQAVNAGSTGAVRLQANTGNVTQTATGVITAGTLGVRAGGNIVLDATSNQLASGGTFAVSAGGSLTFRNANGFTIGTVTALGCFTMTVPGVTAGGVTLCADTGDLSITSPMNVGANTLRLQATTGNVTQTATGNITAGALGVRAGSSIMLAAATNDVDTLAATAPGTVEFKDTDDLTIDTVTASGCFTPTATGITTAGNVCLNTGGPLSIAQPISTGAGTVRIVSAASVAQSGAGTITAAGLGVRAVNPISLGLAGNNVSTFAALTTAAGAPITFTETSGFTVGTITADASCGFAQTNGVTTTNGSVSLTSTGPLTLGDGNGQDITAGNATVDLSAAGATENAGSIIFATGAASGLRLRGSGAFLLNQANQIDLLTAATNGKVSVNDANAITVGTVLGTSGITTTNNDVCLNSGGGALSLTQPINAGIATVRLTAGTDVVQSGAGTINAAALGVITGGIINLNLGNDVNVFAAAAPGNITFRDINDLTIGSVGADPSCGFAGVSGINAPNSVITLTAGRNFSLPSGVNINAGTNALIVNTGLIDIATVTIDGGLQAGLATFNGGDQARAVSSGAAQLRGDTFFITPSPTARILVNGGQPVVVPGDSIVLRNFGGARVTAFVITNSGPGASKDGFFDFDSGLQRVSFTSIETIGQISISVISVQTSPTTFQLFAALNFNNLPVGGNVNVSNVLSVPFVLAPNVSNPGQPSFGAPQVAIGDMTGDGVGDVIVGFGPNNAPLVTVIDGNAVVRAANNPAALVTPNDAVARFFAFDPNFRGGLFVAAGDIDADGKAEIVVGADAGADAHVRTFTNTNGPGQPPSITQFAGPLGSFDAYGLFLGGVRVAVGDVNGDGFGDIITGSGLGAMPHVKVFDGASGALAQSYFAFAAAFQGGIYVNAGDFDGDGKAEILVGAGVGAMPHIKIFRGDIPAFEIASFFAFQEVLALPTPVQGSPATLRGVSSVAFGGLNSATGVQDVLVSTGRGERVRVYSVALGSVGQVVASDPRTRFYVPAFSIPVFVPELIPALGRVLQDGAQLGGVVSASANS